MKTARQILSWLWPYFWHRQSLIQKMKIVTFFLMTVLTTGIILSLPVLLKFVVIALEGKQVVWGISPIYWLLIYGFAWAAMKIVDRLRHQSAFPMMTAIIHDVCLDLFAHVQRLSMSFHSDKQSGKLLNVISRTRWAIIGVAASIFQEILPLVLQVLSASCLLGYYYGLQYGLVLLVMLIAYFSFTIYTANDIFLARQRQNETDSRVNAYMTDSLLNAETVKYFGMEAYEVEQAYDLMSKKASIDVNSQMIDAKVSLGQNTLIAMAVIVLTVMSALDVLRHQQHVSDFVLINVFMLLFLRPLMGLGMRYREAKYQLGHLESAFDLLHTPITVHDAPDANPLSYQGGLIEFKHVSFSYKSARQILKDVSFVVKPGITTAIVGSSGSGKSTIARLLFRLYDVDAGQVIIDGQDVRAITRASLCETLGIVSQDTLMFNDSIRNNMCYALGNTGEDLDRVIHLCQLESLIEQLPQGLDTPIGERGLKLSGGERQRLSIARMLMRHPKVMIFDEATSALDTVTENKIQQCIMAISKDMTTIIIAHRLSTIKHADHIIVLHEGRVAEQGTHDSLNQPGSIYADLLAKQEKGF